MGWDIRISKKFVPSSLIKECDRIPLVEWQRYVDNDKELMWEENSPLLGFSKQKVMIGLKKKI